MARFHSGIEIVLGFMNRDTYFPVYRIVEDVGTSSKDALRDIFNMLPTRFIGVEMRNIYLASPRVWL